MDTQILKDQLAGLEKKGLALAEDEKKFLEMTGLKKESEKFGVEIEELEEDLETTKSDLKKKTDEKAAALAKTMGSISEKITEVLPGGTGVFKITSDYKVVIGWDIDGSSKSYGGLSGGEKVAFDTALLHALDAYIICQEVAEMDDARTVSFMEKLSGLRKQTILCSCHDPFGGDPLPNGWEMRTFKNKPVTKPDLE